MMPTSPFGLAYGIGTALTGAPTAFNQMANQDMQRKLQGLQLQQAQRQEAEQQALQQAATGVKPQMDTVAVPPSLADSAAQLSSLAPSMTPASPTVQAGVLGSNGLNLPGATAIPNAPTSAQIAQVGAPMKGGTTKQVPHQYTTPQEQAAYRSQAMADYLYKHGMPQIAMKLDQQAVQYHALHIKEATQRMASAGLVGDYGAAQKYASSIGWNITQMKPDPNDPDIIHIQSKGPDGSPQDTLISKEDFNLAASSGDPSAAYMRAMTMQQNYQTRLMQAQIAAQQRAKSTAEATQQKAVASENSLKAWLSRSAATVKAAGIRAGALPPSAKMLDFLVVKNERAGMSPADALAAAKEDPSYLHVKDNSVAALSSYRVLVQNRMRELTHQNGDAVPAEGTPQGAEYDMWSKELQGVAGGLKAKGVGGVPAPVTPHPFRKPVASPQLPPDVQARIDALRAGHVPEAKISAVLKQMGF